MTIEEKIEAFRAGLLTLLPGIDTDYIKYGTLSRGLDKFHEIHFNIPPDNKNLLKSPYFYNKKTFVHFSNVAALNSMLQERSIRLYNLHNLNDPREFTFASKIFGLDESVVEDAKSNIFLISCCKREILKNSIHEFNMWRLYGQNGKGLIIIFSVFNDPSKWRDFHLSKVFYGSNKRSVFIKLIELINELNKVEPFIYVDFGKLLAFHKSRLFELEKEVRLVFDRREKREGMHSRTFYNQNQLIFPIIKPDLLKLADNKDKIQYLRLPLFYPSNINYEPEIPVLKIDQIIIGYNLIEEVPKLIKSITEMCEERLKYKPIVKQTRLKYFYWDIKK